jgi:hypothetical protein
MVLAQHKGSSSCRGAGNKAQQRCCAPEKKKECNKLDLIAAQYF